MSFGSYGTVTKEEMKRLLKYLKKIRSEKKTENKEKQDK